MTPQEFLRFHVQNITTETELRGKFKLFFPNLEYSEALIPRTNGEERLKIKRVDGLGIFLFYSRRGKRQFHEHLLDIITEELRRQGGRDYRFCVGLSVIWLCLCSRLSLAVPESLFLALLGSAPACGCLP